MDESRRERKKRQTRELLATTAMKLFAEQGYEQTTVAQIASAADVATKTFFNHFPSKEDVLFADRHRNTMPLEIIASRRPGESPVDLLIRAFDETIADYRADTAALQDREQVELYVQLVMTVPALQARALRMVFDVQKQIAAALVRAYPDELDPISAAALVGSLAGAAQQATLASLELGHSETELWESMRRGIEVAMHGLHRY